MNLHFKCLGKIKMKTFPVSFFTFDFCSASLSSSDPIAIKGLKQATTPQLKQQQQQKKTIIGKKKKSLYSAYTVYIFSILTTLN